MIRKMVAVSLFVIIAASIGLLAIYFYKDRSIEYSWLYSYEIQTPTNGKWRVVSHRGFYTGENFANDYASQTDMPLPSEIDTVNYTYVVCYGFTLEGLSYREIDKSGRFTSDTPYYYVNATLKAAPSTLANVYLVDDPIAIDRDMHTNYGRDTIIIH